MTRWTDKAFLRDVQYRTHANLTARQVLVRAVTSRLPGGAFEDTSHGGFLVCG
jgi:hypothetical protein